MVPEPRYLTGEAGKGFLKSSGTVCISIIRLYVDIPLMHRPPWKNAAISVHCQQHLLYHLIPLLYFRWVTEKNN